MIGRINIIDKTEEFMNIFKKIGAALLAAALTATMAISASASSGESKTPNVLINKAGDFARIVISGLSEKYNDCDIVGIRVEFSKDENGETVGNKRGIVGTHTLSDSYGTWQIYDKEIGSYLGGEENVSGPFKYENGTLIILIHKDNLYFKEFFLDNNSFGVNVQGKKGENVVEYLPNGELTETDIYWGRLFRIGYYEGFC